MTEEADRIKIMELAVRAWSTQQAPIRSLHSIACEIEGFVRCHEAPDRDHGHDHGDKLDSLARHIAELIRAVNRAGAQTREELRNMTAALDRINASNQAQTAAIQAETVAVDAAIAAGIGGAPAGDTQDALNAAADVIDANVAATNANAQRLAAATPPPV